MTDGTRSTLARQGGRAAGSYPPSIGAGSLSYVLFLSLLALVPVNTDASLALVGINAALCPVYSCVIPVRAAPDLS
jgi:hypothetical protein